MLPRTILGSSYSIPLDVDVFEAILLRDDIYKNNTLADRLSLVEGISRANYSMYFGDFIYLSIEYEYDVNDTWELITELILDYIGARYEN